MGTPAPPFFFEEKASRSHAPLPLARLRVLQATWLSAEGLGPMADHYATCQPPIPSGPGTESSSGQDRREGASVLALVVFVIVDANANSSPVRGSYGLGDQVCHLVSEGLDSISEDRMQRTYALLGHYITQAEPLDPAGRAQMVRTGVVRDGRSQAAETEYHCRRDPLGQHLVAKRGVALPCPPQ